MKQFLIIISLFASMLIAGMTSASAQCADELTVTGDTHPLTQVWTYYDVDLSDFGAGTYIINYGVNSQEPKGSADIEKVDYNTVKVKFYTQFKQFWITVQVYDPENGCFQGDTLIITTIM